MIQCNHKIHGTPFFLLRCEIDFDDDNGRRTLPFFYGIRELTERNVMEQIKPKDYVIYSLEGSEELVEHIKGTLVDSQVELKPINNDLKGRNIIAVGLNDAYWVEDICDTLKCKYVKNPLYLMVKERGDKNIIKAGNHLENLIPEAMNYVKFERAAEIVTGVETFNGSHYYIASPDGDVFWDSKYYDIYNRFYGNVQTFQHAPSVYFDLDGTCAKWYKDGRGLIYPEQILDPRYHYYRNLEPHPFTIEMAKLLQGQGADVCIISAADISCVYDKIKWVEENMPFIKLENIFFCPIGADKTAYIKHNAEKSVLVDDYNKNLIEWQQAGGFSAKLVNTVNSVSDKFFCIRCDLAENNGEKHWKNEKSRLMDAFSHESVSVIRKRKSEGKEER